jgi:L-fucose isomerase-like protein
MTRSMSGTTGTFSQVYAEVVPRPEATVMARIIASGDRSLRIRPSTRCEMNGSIIANSRRPARSDTACAQACRVAAVAGSSASMRSSILPPSNPIRATAAAS